MISPSLPEQVQLFKSVFKGRDDVFAIRWEKGNKSGYMPAHSFDPYFYRAHKAKGGTFQNYKDKTYLALTDAQIEKHLKGDQLAGIYPLLTDNTSWFIAADFDKEKWEEECRAFVSACKEKGITAYLERSRSGKGGHVWIFFEQPYPALRSRKICISILEERKIFSPFDKGSFDRLFPNQDFHSGKGLGNLIALPLHKSSWEQGNSCFINPNTLEPIQDQWNLLRNIIRVPKSKLDDLYNEIAETKTVQIPTGKLQINLSNSIHINRNGLTLKLTNFLKEELNFTNEEFFIKQKSGRNTYDTKRYFKFIEEKEHELIIPKGFIGKLVRYCKEENLDYEFIDNRSRVNSVVFSFHAQLKPYQISVINTLSKKDIGVIVAPPGSGKTVIALKVIADRQQPTLIIVHRKHLAEQWLDRIETFLGIPKHQIGKIGQGKNKSGEQITVATIQSLTKELEKPVNRELVNSFGTIILDECHHIPAETFRTTLSKFNSYYLYGLTATPFRKYNDGKIIFIHLGEIISEIKLADIPNAHHPKVIIRNTELDVPFNSRTDRFETISKILAHDSSRNKLVLKDIRKELDSGNKAVIITERKEHIDTLNQYLKQFYETVTLSGEDSDSNRKLKWKTVKEGNYQALITTGQFFGEGTDIQDVHCLFLVYPFSFEGKLIQYIGRVQRSEIAPIIYDYRDIKIDYLNRLFLKRNTYYRKIEQLPTLFDDPVEVEIVKPSDVIKIDQQIRIPIEKLEFQYGSVTFKYRIEEIQADLDFDIENLDIRPEFEVLKPYFAKTLKSKNVKIHIHAEFENRKIVSQLATSTDISKISREIIEGVKFRFITKHFLEKPKSEGSTELIDINQLQVDKESLDNSGEELLNDILSNRNFRHKRHLQYLADLHEKTILKLRFVLSPFSFVFLLKGKINYHIILETLDTEEATYMWYFDADKRGLPAMLKLIDEDLNTIRNKGRQSFLENAPINFSRVHHDYSDDRKGFVIWKDSLEERLT
ncbi:MAG: DEAD/DEAH box helicase family protein [Cytophagales bacterium]|nr:DEAD/DEAH box helicase family protein [Cytophagales bacterium]MCA6370643.1 DEAD/DEAH box helicase family protein [Cytophagales bacterium]MCA6377921.1 DEAD/DEAH box helicase family protein [Cytophagales bacterium]MCA6385767.1 DEAD/DEAH box helicase family protein [Cytophagales bacterium]